MTINKRFIFIPNEIEDEAIQKLASEKSAQETQRQQLVKQAQEQGGMQ